MPDTRFIWDPKKAASNLQKHGVTFNEAATVFEDTNAYYEEDHSASEPRVAVIGLSSVQRAIFVVFIEVHDDVVRIITARKATPHERKKYAKDLPLLR